ncbi:hypothetical protein E2C01_057683 [Portunus trituberculatus]|uniref:Uncharacterized protein n=1 Tax=Portunus trituberculatus TaxID=210409 RepID=A0A5B7H426_PORTR|nr:hypothetical protein [Portunus trituberculatus]
MTGKETETEIPRQTMTGMERCDSERDKEDHNKRYFPLRPHILALLKAQLHNTMSDEPVASTRPYSDEPGPALHHLTTEQTHAISHIT